ncbi:diadenosine tetraphosphatase [Litchfieldella qijiaojingensis]|uniref:Diadenosine tetraphosphatase n=1 Tax=Litchfieldella qijiaojingensis TaxID=980347 RepID=A0ABQ2YHL0_9GAMM|nr:metallophosphoesterase [Halomonas qijiaojingensis]GGX82336.1 diadenosine tetraphosphatase [Halomonas qijiaojingensis]
MFDLIGDIHGYATPLKRLLVKLGYQERQGVWSHPERRVIYLGDFVDRGPEQVETVHVAQTMVENGQALAVMGNHEFNAVAWASEDPDIPGEHLRRHNDKHRRQHQLYLEQVGEGSALHRDHIDWFKTLPLYLDLEGLRVVHACWHRPSLDQLADYLDDRQRILPVAWRTLTRERTPAYDALETLLKGLEVPLPTGIEFNDKDGNPRRLIRTRWWELEGITYRDLAMVPAEAIEEIPHVPIPEDVLPGYEGDKPLFVGHYWLTGIPEPLTPHIACLDYSIAAGHAHGDSDGKLCAYRWDGEAELDAGKFVWVE